MARVIRVDPLNVRLEMSAEVKRSDSSPCDPQFTVKFLNTLAVAITVLHLTGLNFITQYKTIKSASTGCHGWPVMNWTIEPCCLNEWPLRISAGSIIPFPGIALAVMAPFNDSTRG